MYLKRKIDEYLLEWKKNEERLPLIIKGARQVGKTESINHFAEQNYSNIVSINFVLEPKYKTILSDGYAVESFEDGNLIGNVVNVSIDEDYLDENGKIDVDKMEIIAFDMVNNTYRVLGENVGKAFKDGFDL